MKALFTPAKINHVQRAVKSYKYDTFNLYLEEVVKFHRKLQYDSSLPCIVLKNVKNKMLLGNNMDINLEV